MFAVTYCVAAPSKWVLPITRSSQQPRERVRKCDIFVQYQISWLITDSWYYTEMCCLLHIFAHSCKFSRFVVLALLLSRVRRRWSCRFWLTRSEEGSTERDETSVQSNMKKLTTRICILFLMFSRVRHNIVLFLPVNWSRMHFFCPLKGGQRRFGRFTSASIKLIDLSRCCFITWKYVRTLECLLFNYFMSFYYLYSS